MSQGNNFFLLNTATRFGQEFTLMILLFLLVAFAAAWTHQLRVHVPLALLNIATEDVMLPMATITVDERNDCFDIQVRVDRDVAESAIAEVLHTLMQHDAEECALVRSSEAISFDARVEAMIRAAVEANPGRRFLRGYEMQWNVCPSTLEYSFGDVSGSLVMNEKLFCHVQYNVNEVRRRTST